MNNDIIKQIQEIVDIENVLYDEKSRIEFSTDALDCMEEINLPDVIVFIVSTIYCLWIVDCFAAKITINRYPMQ